MFSKFMELFLDNEKYVDMYLKKKDILHVFKDRFSVNIFLTKYEEFTIPELTIK
jgi:hypothetical protein